MSSVARIMFPRLSDKVRLPCYEGYSHFVILPVPQAVSNLLLIWIQFNIGEISIRLSHSIIAKYNKITSSYVLLDHQIFKSPVPSGHWVELPLLLGYKYVAYKGKEGNQVWLRFDVLNCIWLIPKVSTVTVLNEKPDLISHLNYEYHLLDLKVALYF